MRAQPLLFFAVLGLAIAGSPLVAAQTQAVHPGEYEPADIAYGSRLYDAQCTTCHGANGDGVGGVDLRERQLEWRGASDRHAVASERSTYCRMPPWR